MRVAVLITLLFLSACKRGGLYNVVEEKHSDLAAARAESLFERGWLPDILPESTSSIVCRNDLDINTSEGIFTIDTADTNEFTAKLRECRKSAIDVDEYHELGKAGFRPQCYVIGDSYWVFYVNRENGKCVYRLLPESTL